MDIPRGQKEQDVRILPNRTSKPDIMGEHKEQDVRIKPNRTPNPKMDTNWM